MRTFYPLFDKDSFTGMVLKDVTGNLKIMESFRIYAGKDSMTS